MDYVVVCTVALLASGLTLFSGFGLGTLLLPAFTLFFSIPLAVALTAVVHFLSNLFKLLLLGRHAKLSIVWRFGLPAVISAMAGAWLLLAISDLPPLATYHLWGVERVVLPVKVVVASRMVGFALLDVLPVFARVTMAPAYLPIGGLLSGFFGGLSGHQGALRSAFLLKCGLSKEQFIATGVAIACVVDVSRLSVYGSTIAAIGWQENGWLLVAATAAAFLGAWVAARLITRVTMRAVQWVVAILLCLIALGVGSGLI